MGKRGSYPTAGVGSRMGLFPEPPALSSDALTRFPEERPRELLSLVASLLGAPARAPSSSTQAPYSSSLSSKSGLASALHRCGREGGVISGRLRRTVGKEGHKYWTTPQGSPWAIYLSLSTFTPTPDSRGTPQELEKKEATGESTHKSTLF